MQFLALTPARAFRIGRFVAFNREGSGGARYELGMIESGEMRSELGENADAVVRMLSRPGLLIGGNFDDYD